MENAHQRSRGAFLSLALSLVASLMLAGCNYPTGVAATATASVVPTSQPSETAAPSATPQPSNTPAPSATPSPTETPAPSDTPEPTATQAAEQTGVVILNGQEIGLIQRSGEKFTYIANPNKLTPEVEGKVVLNIKDPQGRWRFNLENSSSTMYNFKADPRSGWEAYGVLVAFEGSYEITVKFIAFNGQSGEKLNGKVRIKIVGATVLATDTPEVELP